MNNAFSTEKLILGLRTNKFVQSSSMPMGYVAGLPILAIQNENLCMKVPYLKYKVTGEVDKTYVYPIRYIFTISVPEGIIVGFEDLTFNKSYGKVDFNSPIGTFRHKAVKDLDKTSYNKLRQTLYAEYDKIIHYICGWGELSSADENHFRTLLNIILEPSLHPFYKAIDNDFSTKYLLEV